MSDNIQMICHINNHARQELKVLDYHLDWGKFYDAPNQYPTDIPAKHEELGFRSSGRQGSSSGTEGWVRYTIGGDENAIIKISWDVPWLSGAHNMVKAGTTNEDIAAEIEGFSGTGSVEDVTVKVVDGR